MNRYTGAFTDGVEAVDDVIRVTVFRNYDLAIDVGWNASHLVMNGWHNRNRLFGYINVGKVHANLVHRWQTLHDGLSADMG